MADRQPMVKRLDDSSPTLFSLERPVAWSWLEPVKAATSAWLHVTMLVGKQAAWKGKEKERRSGTLDSDRPRLAHGLAAGAGAAADGKHTLTA
jgi:hypothetical protein